MGKRAWSTDQIEHIAALAAMGWSSGQIAHKFETTRNTICGVCWRRGIKLKWVYRPDIWRVKGAPPAPKVIALPTERKARRKRATATTVKQVIANIAQRAPDQPMPALRTVEAENPRPWLERRYLRDCSWPIGEGADMLMCCAPTGGGIYCGPHGRINRSQKFTPASEFMRGLRRWVG